MVIFVITGIFCVFKLDEEITFKMIPCFLFKCFVISSPSFFKYFIIKSLLFCLIFFILYLFTFARFGYFVVWLLIFNYSFLLGKFVGYLICLFSGCFLFAVIYLTVEFVLIFLATIILLRFLNFNKQLSIYGNCYIRGEELKIILFAFIIFAIIILTQSIIIFTFGKLFI